MRWSRSLIPTLKGDPADADAVSHKVMVRAGMAEHDPVEALVVLEAREHGKSETEAVHLDGGSEIAARSCDRTWMGIASRLSSGA